MCLCGGLWVPNGTKVDLPVGIPILVQPKGRGRAEDSLVKDNQGDGDETRAVAQGAFLREMGLASESVR